MFYILQNNKHKLKCSPHENTQCKKAHPLKQLADRPHWTQNKPIGAQILSSWDKNQTNRSLDIILIGQITNQQQLRYNPHWTKTKPIRAWISSSIDKEQTNRSLDIILIAQKPNEQELRYPHYLCQHTANDCSSPVLVNRSLLSVQHSFPATISIVPSSSS